jgi:hypothetical protein
MIQLTWAQLLTGIGTLATIFIAALGALTYHIEVRFNSIEVRFNSLEKRLESIERRLERLESVFVHK